MRALIQRVQSARVEVAGTPAPAGSIDTGLLVFLGVGRTDTEVVAERLWSKIRQLRVFEDEAGKTNRSLDDVRGQVLVVSQFTLYADCRRGNRPSFTDAGDPAQAERLYAFFCDLVRRDLGAVERGVFGADMAVSLVNSGPFTVWLDTDDLWGSPRTC